MSKDGMSRDVNVESVCSESRRRKYFQFFLCNCVFGFLLVFHLVVVKMMMSGSEDQSEVFIEVVAI